MGGRIDPRLRKLVTGVVTDTLARMGLDGWMTGVFPARTDATVVGPAVTVRYSPRRGADQLGRSYYEIIHSCKPGDVLVIEAGGTQTSVFGGNMATYGQVNGLAAMITDGRCRDFGEMMRMKMPVFCQGPTVRLPMELEVTGFNVPITCGGSQVNPGDLVVADIDGVVVIPKSRLEDVLREYKLLESVESDLAKACQTGVPPADILAILKRKKKPS